MRSFVTFTGLGSRESSVRRVWRKESDLGSQGRKGNLLKLKWAGDWPSRRTSALPFWQGPSYIPPTKNSQKGWSCSRRSGIWWSHSFEKIGASEITGCHLGNLVSLKDNCDLCFVCEVGITSHLISETPRGPYHTWLPPKMRPIKPTTRNHLILLRKTSIKNIYSN